jgi:chromosome segregation ATPase
MEIEGKVSAEQRLQMIAEAAYFRAEARGFHGGDPVADWIDAEAEVDAQIRHTESEQLLERLEACIATATKRFNTLKKKVSGAAADARAEWRDDVEKLGKLRDSLRDKVQELRADGERAGQKARRQAERVWDEISDVMQRVTARTSH